MYDKYSKITPFTLSSNLPKNKGIMFVCGASTSGATVTAVKGTNGVVSIGLTFSANTTNIFPIQVQQVTALGSGLTGYYLS